MDLQTFEIAVGDTGPSIVENLKNADGTAINLAGATVRFRLYDSSGVLVIDRPAVVVDAANGQVRYDWQAGDTVAGGTFFRRWHVTLGTGQVVSVPTEDGLDGYPVEIIDPATHAVTGRLVCSAWCDQGDVVACGPCRGATFDPSWMGEAIDIASDLLYLLSGKQYPGVCTRTDLRPTCVATPGVASLPWVSGDPTARRDATDAMHLYGLPIALLPVYPVISVTQVRVNGIVLDPSTYMILDDRWLARMDGEGWPAGQDFTKPLTAQGTFGVSVSFGAAPPPAGRRGSAAYACQIVKACAGDSSCALPAKTQSIVRSGLSARVLDADDYTENGKTGVPEADRFIRAVNPNGLQERPVILSPDTAWPVHQLR